MKRFSFYLIPIGALLISSAASANPKLDCSIHFSVYTKEGQTVEGATIKVTDSRHGWTKTKKTSPHGHVVFHGIRPDGIGHQTITIHADGYVPQEFSSVACPLGQRVRGRIRLDSVEGGQP